MGSMGSTTLKGIDLVPALRSLWEWDGKIKQTLISFSGRHFCVFLVTASPSFLTCQLRLVSFHSLAEPQFFHLCNGDNESNRCHPIKMR